MPRHMASEHNRSTQTNHQTPQHLAPNTDPIRHKICASVATFMVTGALSTTAFAADSLTFEGGSETTEAINTDTFRWGGAGTDDVWMGNYDGAGFTAKGDVVLTVDGNNTVAGDIAVSDGSLTIKGDESKAGDEKPSITIVEGVDAADESDGVERPELVGTYDKNGGDVTITDAQVTFDTESGAVRSSKGDVNINRSRVGVADADNQRMTIDATEGKLTIRDSVIQAGTSSGLAASDHYIHSNGLLTIDNSAVQIKSTGRVADQISELKIYSPTGVELNNMANGEVKTATTYNWYGTKAYFLAVDNGEGYSDLRLSPATVPAYYNAIIPPEDAAVSAAEAAGLKQASAKGILPRTSDDSVAVEGMAIAGAVAMGLGIAARSRRRAMHLSE